MEGVIRKDPPVRQDGRCYVCKKPRVVPASRQKGVPIDVYLQDPFCSNMCARTYHDAPMRSAFTSSR